MCPLLSSYLGGSFVVFLMWLRLKDSIDREENAFYLWAIIIWPFVAIMTTMVGIMKKYGGYNG